LNSSNGETRGKILILGLLFALGAVWLFGWIAKEMLAGDTVRFDEHVRSVIHEHSSPVLTRIMQGFSLIGSPLSLALLTLASFLLFRWTGWNREAVLLAVCIGGGALLDQFLKFSFRRLRPVPYFHLVAPSSYSFPSGHALLSFCFFGVVTSLISARLRNVTARVALLTFASVFIAMIGYSRIYLGVHYPTDVIAGYIAAFIWVTAVTAADRFYYVRRSRR
jgi:undecaprenyl-diphosphatase